MREFEIRTDPVQINAPIDVVWSVLTEVDKYSEWNPFTPRAGTDFTIGSPVNLRVRMGPAKFRITESVRAFEKPRLIAWKKEFGARWLRHAVREQHLKPVGKTSCSYHNTERLTGVLAAMVSVCFGAYMRRGFGGVAEGLKAYAEAIRADADSFERSPQDIRQCRANAALAELQRDAAARGFDKLARARPHSCFLGV